MIQKIKTASREEWLELRKQGIGGSDAGCILGMNPWKSAYSLWAEKAGVLEPEDISKKEAVRLGNYLEEYVAKRFEEETGKKVRRENATWRNDRYPFAQANFDRLIVGEKAGLEIKTTSELNTKRFHGQEFPEQYYCQCIHYLMVSELERWYLAVLIGNRELRIFCLERDESEIQALADAEERFWIQVQEGVPPAADGSQSTSETLGRMYPDGQPETVDLERFDTDLETYFRLLGMKKELETDMDAISNRIKQYMGSSDTGLCSRAKITWRTAARSSFDSKAFLDDHPEYRDAYTKTTQTRTFRVSRKGA